MKLKVTVKNTGPVAGKEVVQVYVADVVSSVVTPVKNLVGFEKVDLAADASTRVSITVPAAEFGLWSLDQKWVFESELFIVMIGTSEQVYANSTFTVAS